MSIGSLANPTGFLALAIKPDLPQQPMTAFGALMALSFTATTIGYGGAAVYVIHVRYSTDSSLRLLDGNWHNNAPSLPALASGSMPRLNTSMSTSRSLV